MLRGFRLDAHFHQWIARLDDAASQLDRRDALAVRDQHFGQQAARACCNEIGVERYQPVALSDLVTGLDVRSESFALEFHRVESDVDHDFHPIGVEGKRVVRPMDLYYAGVTGCDKLLAHRIDCHSISHQPLGEYRVRHAVDGHNDP